MGLQVCPFCDIAMEVKVREHVMIDVCPSCRGVWLDRGELEKIIADVRREESGGSSTSTEYEPVDVGRGEDRHRDQRPRDERPRDERRRDERRRHDSRSGKSKDKKDKRKKKRSSFFDLIEDVLDFD